MIEAPVVKSSIKPKKTMTSIDLAAWIAENKELILTARITNVYRTEGSPSTFMLKMHTRQGTKFLIMEPSSRIHFTQYRLPTPSSPDGLTMAIRRHVRGSIIRDVRQVGFDRIVEFSLSNKKKLVLELLPRGVLAVVGDENKLLVANEYREMRDRTIRPGVEYKLPPHYSNTPDTQDCRRVLAREDARSLVARLGIPYEVLKEAQERVGENGDLCAMVEEVISESMEHKGYLVLSGEDDRPLFFSPYKPTHVLNALKEKAELREHDSFDNVVDEYFSKGMAGKIGEHHVSKLKSERGRLETRLEKERRLAKQYEEKASEMYAHASLLLTYRDVLQQVLDCVNAVRKTDGWDKVVEKCPGVNKASPSTGKVTVTVNGGQKITLAVNVPVKVQIEELFEKAKKLRKKAETARHYLVELEKKIVEREKREHALKNMIVKTVRRREWYENYWWSLTRTRKVIVAGKDASQNEVLVRKYLETRDIFLHADIHGAPATILKLGKDVEPLEEDIQDASRIAAVYSRAWKRGIAVIDVFWVRADQVSKAPPSGEYLAKGSFMIYGRKNYVRNVPLKLALGIQEWGEGLRFIVGTEEAVDSAGRLIALIVPGDVERERVSRKVVEKAWSKGMQTPPPQELSQMLPGRARILKFYI